MLMKNPLYKNPYQGQGTECGHAGDEKERLILQHRKLVKYMALRIVSRLPDHVSVDDLYSAGIIGLIDAIDKYDSNQGIPFEYYAKIRVKGAMLDEIRSMDWIPRSLRQKSSLLEKTCVTLERKLGRYPTDEEIAEELELGIDGFHKLLDETKGISFLPENVHDAVCEAKEAAFLASDSDELFLKTYRKEIQDVLAEAIGSLSQKEQTILSLYYYEEFTMKEIGTVMGYTESRISQIHTKAVLKLRTRLARKLDKDDLPTGVGLSGDQAAR